MEKTDCVGKKVYVIRDNVAMEGSDLIVAKNDAVAIRLLRGFCQKSQVNPGDFTLFRVGAYSPEHLKLDALEMPVAVSDGLKMEVVDES